MSKIQLMLDSIDHEARIAINLIGELHAVRTSVRCFKNMLTAIKFKAPNKTSCFYFYFQFNYC